MIFFFIIYIFVTLQKLPDLGHLGLQQGTKLTVLLCISNVNRIGEEVAYRHSTEATVLIYKRCVGNVR